MIKYFVLDFETTGLNYSLDLPVEIGGLFCDENWVIEDTLNYLIKWQNLMDRNEGWGQRYWEASVVHKINYEEYIKNAISVDEIVKEIIRKTKGYKPTLVSDCINFEWHWMDILLRTCQKDIKNVFHYCGWDTSLLLEASGVKDPKSAHRAFKDACLLYKAIIKAFSRIDYKLTED